MMKRKLNILNIRPLVVLMLMACGAPEEATDTAEPIQEPPAVEVQKVSTQELPVTLTYTGNVEAWQTAYITGQNGVRIEEIYVDEGDHVRKGQLLVQMNAAQLDQARAQLNLARREVERLDTLVEIGSVARQQLDQAQTEYENALSNFQSLQQNVRLTAPFGGVITAKHFIAGEAYVPSAESPAILTLAQISPVKVQVDAGEQYYGQIEAGMQAEVRVDVYPDTVFMGQIYKKFPTIDPASRTFKVEIRVDNDKELLRPGMFARVTIPLEQQEGVYIPATAVVRQAGSSEQYVFVLEDSVVQRQPVVTGNQHEALVRIDSGLTVDQVIVTEGMAKLQDSTHVRVMNRETIQRLTKKENTSI